MAVMVGIVGALSLFIPKKYDFSTNKGKWVAVSRLLATSNNATMHINTHRTTFIYPKNELSYSENFLHMLFQHHVANTNPQAV